MKPENVAIVMTDGDTGRAYMRSLSQWESNLVLAQLQALDSGKLKVTEIAPVILRSAGMTEERARELMAQKTNQQEQHQ